MFTEILKEIITEHQDCPSEDDCDIVTFILQEIYKEIEQAMPEKYQKGICSNPSTNHIHGDKEVPINFWTSYHDQYNAMIDEVTSNLLKAIGKADSI